MKKQIPEISLEYALKKIEKNTEELKSYFLFVFGD